MNKTERKIIHQCAGSLSCLPGQNNAMSAHGASEYSSEIKSAIGLNTKVMFFLLDGDLDTAQAFANDLTSMVYSILIKNGLSITVAMQYLKNQIPAGEK